jgi:hypothetical protein
MELSVEHLCGLLIRSKLLPADEVKALYQRWKSEAKSAQADVGPFSQWLTAGEYLNKFQAALLAAYLQCVEQGLTPSVEPVPRKASAPAGVTERTPEPPPPEPFDFGAAPLQPRGRKVKETPRPNRSDVDTVDVELVEGSPPPLRPVAPGPPLGLSLRDWLMMGFGAGAVIVTALAGMLAARWGS